MTVIKHLRVLLSAESEGFRRGLDDSAKALTHFRASLGGIVAGTLSVGALTKLLSDSSKAADEAARVQAQLGAVLQSTGGAAGVTANDVNSLATEISRLTGYEDEALVRAQSLLLTFTRVGKDVFPDATRAAVDMSAALGQDLQSSVTMLGRALHDPIQGVTALRRVGVVLTEQQREQIRQAMEQNNLYAAQRIILDELATEFGGTAQAMEEASLGTNRLKVEFGNLQEAVGAYVNRAGRPLVDALTNQIIVATNAIEIGERLRAAEARGVITRQELVGWTMRRVMTEELAAEVLAELDEREAAYAHSLETTSDVGVRMAHIQGQLAATARDYADAANSAAQAILNVSRSALGREQLDALNAAYQDGVINQAQYEAAARRIMTTWLEMEPAQATAGIILGRLKDDYDNGRLSALEYAQAVERIAKSLYALDGREFDARLTIDIVTVGAIPAGMPQRAQPQMRQAGGVVAPEHAYWVGESGPELIVPSVGGYVLSRDEAMAAMGVHIGQIVINAAPGQDGEALYEQFRAALERDLRRRRSSGANYIGG